MSETEVSDMGKWVMRVTDAIAEYLIHELDGRAQLRIGVWLVFASLPLYVYAPFSGEPPLIYLMSAAAITLTGLGLVVGAQVLEQIEDAEDVFEDAEDAAEQDRRE